MQPLDFAAASFSLYNVFNYNPATVWLTLMLHHSSKTKKLHAVHYYIVE